MTEEELKRVYQQRTARSGAAISNCLSADQLARAADGELSAGERDRVADHLMACSDCAEEYRILASLKVWANEAGTSSEAGAASLLKLERKRRGSQALRGGWRQRLSGAFSPAYALGAALLVITLTIVAWMVVQWREDKRVIARLDREVAERDQAVASAQESLEEARRRLDETNRRAEQEGSSEQAQAYEARIAELQRSLDELSRPQLNAPIIDLEPRGSLRGESRSAKTIEVPSSANLFTLVMNVTGQQNYSGYSLEILDQSGKVIWRGGGLRKSQDNTFTVTLPRKLLPTGQYQIKLYGVSGGQRKLVEDYAVRIHYR